MTKKKSSTARRNEWWEKLSSERGENCEMCGAAPNTKRAQHIHHKHYRTIDEVFAVIGNVQGDELVILCTRCHLSLHQRIMHKKITESDWPFIDPLLAAELKEKATEEQRQQEEFCEKYGGLIRFYESLPTEPLRFKRERLSHIASHEVSRANFVFEENYLALLLERMQIAKLDTVTVDQANQICQPDYDDYLDMTKGLLSCLVGRHGWNQDWNGNYIPKHHKKA